MPYGRPLYGIFWWGIFFFANMGGGGGQNCFHVGVHLHGVEVRAQDGGHEETRTKKKRKTTRNIRVSPSKEVRKRKSIVNNSMIQCTSAAKIIAKETVHSTNCML